MSYQCLCPRVAYQEAEGEKPKFLKRPEYEFYLKAYGNSKGRILLIGCGKCPNCLKRKSQEWTSRLLKEMAKHKFCYFITLTYKDLVSDDGIIKDINKRDIQLFLKRYRKKYNVDLTYYITGEHGETTHRPHYHAIFFQDKEIPDLRFYADNLFISDDFAKVWSHGNCLISKQVNERSIKYTIAYTLKKLGEEKIVLMSKGIGLDYFKDNKDRIMDHDGFYVLNGYKQKPPYYFVRKLKESNDIKDLMYLEMKKNEFKSSTLLSGDTISSLICQFFELPKEFKGKGVF